MQACSFLFIHRNWEKDQKLLAKVLDYLKESNEVCQVRLTDNKLANNAKSYTQIH